MTSENQSVTFFPLLLKPLFVAHASKFDGK